MPSPPPLLPAASLSLREAWEPLEAADNPPSTPASKALKCSPLLATRRGRLGSSGSSKGREQLKGRREREGGRERGQNQKRPRNTSGLTLSPHTGRNLECGTQSVGVKSQEAGTNVSVPGAWQSQRIVWGPWGSQLSAQQETACWRPGREKWPRRTRVVAGSKQKLRITRLS